MSWYVACAICATGLLGHVPFAGLTPCLLMLQGPMPTGDDKCPLGDYKSATIADMATTAEEMERVCCRCYLPGGVQLGSHN